MSYNDIRATEPPYPTPVNQDDYDALAARLAEAEVALERLLDAANDSDGCQYGTLSTSFVRDLCKRGLRATDSATVTRED